MARQLRNWLRSYLEYTEGSESPREFHLWTGIGTISAALQRRVWEDHLTFKWYPNMYIIFVGPPGIVKKSTTTRLGENLLREVPGIHFGPSTITWQRLVQKMTEVTQEVMFADGSLMPMSCLAFFSSEMGNFLDPRDNDMVSKLIDMWDGEDRQIAKETKTSGNDTIVNPALTLLACTTPDWILSNMPQQMIGGGFTSRCIFVYGDKKAASVAYPERAKRRGDFFALQAQLIEDLKSIAQLCGEFTISEEAYEWGEEWYKRHEVEGFGLTDKAFQGYMGRKQAHMHKLAMCISAAQRDDLIISREILEYSAKLVTALENNMRKVYQQITTTPAAEQSVHVINWLQAQNRRVAIAEVYNRFYFHLSKSAIDEALEIAHRTGLFTFIQAGNTKFIEPKDIAA